MTEGTWGDAASPAIDWRMSAALQNVPRGDGELAEVTNLEDAVRVWLALNPGHRAAATLTPERPLTLDGVPFAAFDGEGIAVLADRLPTAPPAASNDADEGTR